MATNVRKSPPAQTVTIMKIIFEERTFRFFKTKKILCCPKQKVDLRKKPREKGVNGSVQIESELFHRSYLIKNENGVTVAHVWKLCDKAREMYDCGRKAVTNFDDTRIKEIINHTSCKSNVNGRATFSAVEAKDVQSKLLCNSIDAELSMVEQYVQSFSINCQMSNQQLIILIKQIVSNLELIKCDKVEEIVDQVMKTRFEDRINKLDMFLQNVISLCLDHNEQSLLTSTPATSSTSLAGPIDCSYVFGDLETAISFSFSGLPSASFDVSSAMENLS
uniref:Uncharacterized protein n=1 Tax=Panagrolaimus sp. ES5 TaxID=591445 RepID=A0AC34FFT3_9BILA